MSSSRGKARALKIEEHVEFKKLLNASDSNAIAIWNIFSKNRNEDDFNRSVIEILNQSKNKQQDTNTAAAPTKQASAPAKEIKNKESNKSKPNSNKPNADADPALATNKNKPSHESKPKTKSAKEDKKSNSNNADKVHHKKGTEEANVTIDDKKRNEETTASLNSLTQLLKSTMISSTSNTNVKDNLSPVPEEIKSESTQVENSAGGLSSFGLWNKIDDSLSNGELIDSENSSNLSTQGLGFSFNTLGRNNQEQLGDQLNRSDKSLDHWDVAQELMGNLTPQRPERDNLPNNEMHPFGSHSLSSHSPHGFPMHQPHPHGFPHHPGNPMFFPPPLGMHHPMDGHMMMPPLGPPSGHSPFGGALFPHMHPHMLPPNYSQFPPMHHPMAGPSDFNMPPTYQNFSGHLGHEQRSDHHQRVAASELGGNDPILESYKFDEKNVIDLNQNVFSRDQDLLSALTDKLKEPEPVPVAEKLISQEPATPAASKAPQFRTTRNQCARLSISMNQQGRRDHDVVCTENNNSVRPGWHMTIHWEIPLTELQKNDTDYVIALVRLGSPINLSSIVSKKVESNGKSTAVGIDNHGLKVVRGKVPFHAPKSAGTFVYRLFDQSTKEKSFVTMGTSIAFKVDLLDLDVTTSFKFCIDLFQEKSHQRAVSQLRTTIVGMRNSGRPLNGESPNAILSKCVDYMVEVTIQAMQSLEAAKSKVKSDKDTAAITENSEEKSKEDDVWVTVKQAGKLQRDIYDTFCSIRYNDISWMMLPEIYQLRVLRTQELYCPLLNRYFFTPQARDECRQSEFNFIPSLRSSRNQLQEKLSLASLEKAIHDVLPSLLPSPDFHIRRENARMRVQKAICSSGVVPENTELVLYGSSRNNFGTDSADLDMCMIFPPNVNIAIIDRPALIERLAETLGKLGMTDVSSRATARIPIVQFKDPQTGFDCDISFNNPLAVANTKLLKAYSEIDNRVLPLAFVIKHWAKARLINNPGEGTLSSYGYILCLIHYLQHRQVPVLPNLQQLPPDWNGDPNFRKEYPNATWQRNIESHPVDGTPCDTYFYNSPKGKVLLKNFSSRNKETTAELLAGFFQYFAWEFDYRRSVVQIQSLDPVDKLSKAESDCWNQHDRISIEDPFETWYDVAHVVKSAQMFYIRKEFLRAHTLISRCASHGPFDSLPSSVDPQALLGKICENCQEKEKIAHIDEEHDDL